MKALLLICLAAVLLSGCATSSTPIFSRPRYGASLEFLQQWDKIDRGLTVQEVHRLLGEPNGEYSPSFGLQRVEYWLFTATNGRPENLRESYRVWFGRSGHVQAWDQPNPDADDL